MNKLVPLLAACALLASGAALAARLTSVVVPCAVGGAPTKVFVALSDDQRGGWDADGALWSNDAQTRDFAIATCPDNLLSLLSTDMQAGLAEPDQLTLKPLLPGWAAAAGDPRGLAPWDRYGLAVRAYEALNRDAWFLGRLMLQAGWTVRDHAVGPWSGLDGPVTARRIQGAGQAELEAGPPPERERVLRLNLARLALRAGWLAEHRAQVAALVARPDLSPAQTGQLDRLRTAAEREAGWQRGALAAFRALLADAPPADPRRPAGRYLEGELLYRLERPAEARVAFEAVRGEAGASDALKALARFRLDELAGKKPWTAADFKLDLPPEFTAIALH